MSTANALPVSHANYRYATDATISELASPKKKTEQKEQQKQKSKQRTNRINGAMG